MKSVFSRIALLTIACSVSFPSGPRADEAPCHALDGVAATRVEHVDGYTRSRWSYSVPDVTLINQDSQSVSLSELLDQPRPVALNFVFTTCTTICPVMTATFSSMRRELGDLAEDLQLVSISIDPEYDTPEILRKYAERFHADDDWQFLTGDANQITKTLDAFDALTGSKMNHEPFTLFRFPGESEWTRIEGLTTGAALAQEYRQLLAR